MTPSSIFIGQQIITDVLGQPPSSTAGWTTSVGTSGYTSNCNGQTIIGGFEKFGNFSWAWKQYSGLLGHEEVSVQADFYFIDSWDGANSNDSVSLDIDDLNVAYVHYEKDSESSTDFCGNHWTDFKKTYTLGPFPHNSTTIKVHWTIGLDQGPADESFGFKNVRIIVHVICTPACATCFGNDISECYSCNDGWFLEGTTCVNPCPPAKYGDPATNTCKRNSICIFWL